MTVPGLQVGTNKKLGKKGQHSPYTRPKIERMKTYQKAFPGLKFLEFFGSFLKFFEVWGSFWKFFEGFGRCGKFLEVF